jgi:tetratricopeptide (TPR) repeat protein
MIERAIALWENEEQTPEVQTQMVFSLMQKASLLEKSNRLDEALSIYQNAAEIADQSYSRDNTQKFAFNHSVRIRRLMADIYRGRGEWQKALERYDFCLERLRLNQENKNLDVGQMPSAIAIYTMRRGVALDKTGKETEGFEIVEKGLTQYLQYLEGNKSDVSVLIVAPEFLSIASEFYATRNQKRIAANIWKDYTERLEPFLRDSPNDNGLQKHFAGGFENKADVLSGFQAESNSLFETDRSFLKEALENYETSLKQIRQINKDGEPAAEITKKIETLELKIAALKGKLS